MMLAVAGLLLVLFLTLLIARTLRYTRHHGQQQQHIPSRVDIDEAAKRLGKAIRYQTISTQDQEDFNEDAFLQMHHFLEKSFPHLHATLDKEIVSGYSLLYTWKGKNPELKPVMLTSHIDVVPVEPGTEDDWLHPPFEGRISDGYIWGRGAMDVQGGVLAIMEAVEILLETGFSPERTIILGFGHDEEVDGDKGAFQIGRLLEERGTQLEFLLDEGTPIVHDILPQLASPVALVAVAEKGYLSLEISTTAEGGHSSVPQGLTSIAVLSEAIHKLENNPIKGKVDGLVKRTMEAIGPQLPFLFRMVMANLWLFRGLVKRELAQMPATKAALGTTIATTIFESGVKENVLPTQARAIVNFRIHPNDTIDSVIEHVTRTVNDPGITITPLHGSINPSHVSDVKSTPYRMLETTIREVFPEVVVAPTLMVGATDARHYSRLTKNIYRFIPLRADESDLDRVHGTDERISKHNYHEMIFFYTRLLENASS
ncbi:M20 family peptidase [Balneolales bacterium ANBcel1]|nr:M20 family peptidase [Balneolales bacterium ANBcel1]